MTKQKDISTLTEQWQQCKLKDGFYFVKENDEIFISICSNHCLLNVLNDCEVLAPVPDYDHFVELTEKVEELEKLLKECKGVIDECVRSDYIEELKERIDEVLR